MSEIYDKQNENKRQFDPLMQTENIAFDRSDLIACAGCSRLNPPNRINCMYCAAAFELTSANAAAVRPNFRKLESWENGFNLILRGDIVAGNIERAAHLLSLETEDLTRIAASGTPLPVARVESEAEAVRLASAAKESGLICSIVRDIDLGATKMPARLSGMEIRDGILGLKDFNTGKFTEFPIAHLALIVPGVISSSRVETLEKRRRNKESKLIDETATAFDEPLLDIYTRTDENGFRVHLAGFDFSCLGNDKGLLAVENLRYLTVRLKELAPDAKIVDGYARLRHLIGLVWEMELRRDSKGLVQTGFGKRDFGIVSSTNNLGQFTKFSRLQRQLL